MSYKLHAFNDPSERGDWPLDEDAMEELREALAGAGLLDVETPQPPAPLGGGQAALLAWRSQPSPDPSKVPAWKFESDAGWLVTPEECAILAQGHLEDDHGGITAFQQYCKHCIRRGGFQVW